ncbi:MAG: type II toxin-antitoxin system VapC family toxin [Chloroflexi bacterium]|nr:type II toxin-antitoxin system VapC family toxin [Chloroflexota bacterium]
MKYLLDTHAFIWLDNDPGHLSPTVRTVCQDTAHTLFVSVASVWEMQIKIQLGRLTLPVSLTQMVENQRQINHIDLLSISLAHVVGLASLPDHHKDPFDRMLIAQAQVENLTLISNDPTIARYPVQVVW